MGARSRPRATRTARPLALPLLGGIALIASADQALKWLVVTRLGGPFSTAALSLGPSWLQLVVVRNDGVAFGLFQGRPLLFTILSLLIFCLAFVVYWRYLPPNSRWCAIGAACFFGGGLGNLIDRLRQGYVIDIISIGWWPVFNLADSAISVGAAMLILYLLLVGEPPVRQLPRDDALLTHLLDHEP